MSSSSLDTIGNVVTTGTIITIVVGSLVGLGLIITIIVIIVCITKYSNHSRNVTTEGMILQPPQLYPNLHSLSNQYPPNITSVANYPPSYQPTAPPYTALH
ncbi:unnamed protein product [Rotaria sp. Silwood2]|nr:unnamed protein product [Rotaria sp. Silwood2]CAF4130535.1 unnamed protein product [Rotaria sp. Silwood2]